MQVLTLKELKTLVGGGESREVLVHAQVDVVTTKTTKNGKPYYEIKFIDSADHILLRAWSDTPIHTQCGSLEKGHCLELKGTFSNHETYGLEAREWGFRPLSADEKAGFMAGSRETRERQEADFQFIAETVQSINDPRLRIVCEMFLVEHGERFRRTAAAKANHHARRGGLVEHTAQMMRSACAIAGVYTRLNRDLMVAGVLFHDSGKLWENHVAEDAFSIEQCERGELLGHINMGIEIVNSLWRQLKANDAFAAWKKIEPTSESVRLHLLHLIASHHGTREFGSPVLPKTPEAQALHYVDNLDAKMEMFFGVYGSAKQVVPNIYDRTRPFTEYLIEPLKAFPPDGDTAGGWMAPEPAE